MSSWFQLTLDTTAPVVTFGPVTDPNAGEEMSVEYLVNEPGIDYAEVVLADARVLAMVDTGAAFTVLLPDDAPEGTAIVHAYTRDDVDNTAEFTLEVHFSGALAPEATPTLPSLPQPQVVRVRSVSTRGRARASYRASAQLTTTSTVRTSSRYLVPTTMRRLRFEDALTTNSTWRVSGRVGGVTRAASGSATAVHKRPEGPGHEEELFLLGLL